MLPKRKARSICESKIATAIWNPLQTTAARQRRGCLPKLWVTWGCPLVRGRGRAQWRLGAVSGGQFAIEPARYFPSTGPVRGYSERKAARWPGLQAPALCHQFQPSCLRTRSFGHTSYRPNGGFLSLSILLPSPMSAKDTNHQLISRCRQAPIFPRQWREPRRMHGIGPTVSL
jgi:hypothetical protein